VKRAVIYCRVSTDEQTTENQRRELDAVCSLHGWYVVSVLDDSSSGALPLAFRPQGKSLMSMVHKRDVDIVVAWSVDRLGRSLHDLIAFLAELQAKKVDLYLHRQQLDTGTPAGRALFQMLGVFAEFERAIIRERIQAGLARARAEGKHLGRPETPPKRIAEIRRLLRQGKGKLAIARQLNCGVSVVMRVAAAKTEEC
jgi:DNA invertase Pin-like site-specific DNA recombinase